MNHDNELKRSLDWADSGDAETEYDATCLSFLAAEVRRLQARIAELQSMDTRDAEELANARFQLAEANEWGQTHVCRLTNERDVARRRIAELELQAEAAREHTGEVIRERDSLRKRVEELELGLALARDAYPVLLIDRAEKAERELAEARKVKP